MRTLLSRTLLSTSLCIGSLFTSTAFADATGILRCLLVMPDGSQISKDAQISEIDTSIDFQVPGSDLRILGNFNGILNSTQVSIEEIKSGYKAMSTDWSQSNTEKWSSSSVVFTFPGRGTYILQCSASLN